MQKCDRVNHGNVWFTSHVAISILLIELLIELHLHRFWSAQPTEFTFVESTLTNSSASQWLTCIIGYMHGLHNHVIAVQKSSLVAFRHQHHITANLQSPRKRFRERRRFSLFSGIATELIMIQSIVFPQKVKVRDLVCSVKSVERIYTFICLF